MKSIRKGNYVNKGVKLFLMFKIFFKVFEATTTAGYYSIFFL